MATVTAKATGNWSAGSTWSTDPSLPAAGDDVDSNGYTVTIDQNVTVASLINTNASAGGFTVASARTIAANVTASVRTVLSCTNTSGTVTITGTITGGSSASAYGVSITGAGGTTTITASGGVLGGSGSAANGVYIATGAGITVNITGDCTGGSNTNACGVNANVAATVTITGNVTGGSSTNAQGARNSSSGTMTVTLTATGGSGSGATGLNNSGTGTASCTTAVAGTTAGVAGLYGANVGGTTTYKIARCTSDGNQALVGCCKMVVDATMNYIRQYNSAGGSYTDLSNDYPATTDVKNGTVYKLGGLTGSLAEGGGGGVFRGAF